MNAFRTLIIAALGFTALPAFALSDNGQAPVSYTHLTLPTKAQV